MSDGAEMGALVGDVCWLCRETGGRRFEWFAGCSGACGGDRRARRAPHIQRSGRGYEQHDKDGTRAGLRTARRRVLLPEGNRRQPQEGQVVRHGGARESAETQKIGQNRFRNPAPKTRGF